VRSGAGIGLSVLQRRDAEQEAHVTTILRVRRAVPFSGLIWMSFFVVDYFAVKRLGAGTLGFFLTLRLVGLGVILVVRLLAARAATITPARLIAVDVVAHGGMAALIALMCTRFGGIASPYGPGICLILLHRTLMGGDPWRRGALLTAPATLVFPVVMAISAIVDPRVAAQLGDPRDATYFAITLAYLFGTAGIVVVGSHLVWALRRQVFEARSIGRYKLKKRIGEGGMGEVWLAHHAAMRRDVAVKLLRPGVASADSDDAVVRFEREVRATGELVHPNTVRVFDYGVTEDGLWYYAMELLLGEPLGQLVRRVGPLEPARAVHFASQAARALGEAHARGIVHRDVKPANLFVTSMGGEEDFLKVLDFGVASIRHEEGDTALTASGVLVGTPTYMAPEAALGAGVDARADVYALGAVLYFMLTGSPPFEAAGPVATAMAHLSEIVQRPSAKLGRALPHALEAIVMRCLEKSPADRFAGGAELASALAGWRS